MHAALGACVALGSASQREAAFWGACQRGTASGGSAYLVADGPVVLRCPHIASHQARQDSCRPSVCCGCEGRQKEVSLKLAGEQVEGWAGGQQQRRSQWQGR